MALTENRDTTTMNHWPLFGRSLRSECKPIGGTANPHGVITCPCCRKFLTAKINAERDIAMGHRPDTQERRFHTGTADHYQAILDRT